MTREERRETSLEARMPETANVSMTAPACVCVTVPNSLLTSPAPSARNSPLAAEPATMAGAATRSTPRRRGEARNRGRTGPAEAGVFPALSGTSHTSTAVRTDRPVSVPNTAPAGFAVTSRRSAAVMAPVPRPIMGAMVFHNAARPGRCGGSKSTVTAERAGMSRPAATPWSERATSSRPRLSERQKRTRLAASSRAPTVTTGRRPLVSDSGPRNSRVASMVKA